ncbi:MAG TPA: hypothetical protein VGR08_01145 [Thermomicrobiales bacterium]|nr:hypothetical protein [Thermomicrobiales bacterium]
MSARLAPNWLSHPLVDSAMTPEPFRFWGGEVFPFFIKIEAFIQSHVHWRPVPLSKVARPERPLPSRPASKREEEARKLQHHSMNQAFYTHPEIIRSRSEEIERSLTLRRQINEGKRARRGTSAGFRRSIGQMLIAAGERIRPDMA